MSVLSSWRHRLCPTVVRLSPWTSRLPVTKGPVFPFVDQRRYAGHNKWSKVKHIKGAKDAKRSKVYSKISLEIVSAVKAGGADALVNSKLGAILNRAKAASMPKDSIEHAIKKATDKNKDAVEDILYEAYGPGGIAMIIETVTDKRSRTVKEVKEVLNRTGGSISSVGWLFEKKGKIVFAEGESGKSLEERMDIAIDVGAEDMEEDQDLVELTCDYVQLTSIHQELLEQKMEVQQVEATYIPNTTVEVTDKDTLELVLRCLDDMENLDDVVKVHCNVILPSDET